MPRMGTRGVVPTSLAPKCLVESKTRAGTFLESNVLGCHAAFCLYLDDVVVVEDLVVVDDLLVVDDVVAVDVFPCWSSGLD